MLKFRGLRLGVTALAVIVVVGIAASSVFFARRPVVVVIDSAFEDLYGRARAERQIRAASVRLFRRILVASVAESAAPAASADAAAAVTPRPFCVVFAPWYEEGAEEYGKRFPDVPSLILGVTRESSDSFPLAFSADSATDLYRAGRIAGLLGSEDERPLLLMDTDPRFLAAFGAGLSDAGFSGEPVILRPGSPTPSIRFSCLVTETAVGGKPAQEFKDVPSVLFSWIDPALVPPATIAVFDDSVWALLESAVRFARDRKRGTAPSKVWLTIDSKTVDPARIKAAAAARYDDHNSL